MKTLLTALLVLAIGSTALAHTLFMSVTDNEDGTILIEGMYSTGAVASKTPVRVENDQGKLLFQGETDMDGELEFNKPEQAYVIILDGGEGHTVIEEGPQ